MSDYVSLFQLGAEFLCQSAHSKAVPPRWCAYRVSPWALTWDNENYYLIAFDHDAGEIRHYRVDKMDSLVQTDLPREGKQLFDRSGLTRQPTPAKCSGMFSGEEKTVKLKCLNRFIGVMLDRFGSSLRLFPADNEHFVWMWMLSSVRSFFLGVQPRRRCAHCETRRRSAKRLKSRFTNS